MAICVLLLMKKFYFTIFFFKILFTIKVLLLRIVVAHIDKWIFLVAKNLALSQFYRTLCGWYCDTSNSSPDSTIALYVPFTSNVNLYVCRIPFVSAECHSCRISLTSDCTVPSLNHIPYQTVCWWDIRTHCCLQLCVFTAVYISGGRLRL
jgi:hypothetical protein